MRGKTLVGLGLPVKRNSTRVGHTVLIAQPKHDSRRKPTREPGLTLAQARALVSVARTGSYERARIELGVRSATSVFHLVDRMAAAIGADPLVGPSVSGRVSLTAAGNEVLPRAKALVVAFAAFDRARHELRLASYPAMAARAISAVTAFNDRHDSAGVRAVFYEISDEHRRDRGASLIHRAATGEIDLVAAPADNHPQTLASRDLYRWVLRVVLRDDDPRRAEPSVTLNDLAGLELLVSPPGHSSRQLYDRAAAQARNAPTIAMELVDQAVLATIAREGRGYAALIPDDALGLPAQQIGPALLDSNGNAIEGWYALYFAAQHEDAARQGSRRASAVIDLVDAICRALRDNPQRT